MTEVGDTRLQRSSSSALSSSYPPIPFGNHKIPADVVQHPAPLNIAADGCSDVRETLNTREFQNVDVKGEDIESPGSATSKLVEVPFSRKDAHGENMSKTEIVNGHVECDALQIAVSDPRFGGEDRLHGSIWASNRDLANGAVETLNKLLPNKQATFGTHVAAGFSCVVSSEVIRAKLLRRKRFQQFKEKAIALKFNVLQHYWKDDVRLLSSKKFRVKSKKNLCHSSRALENGHHKNHLSLRTGFSAGGKLGLTIPNAKMIRYVGKLISKSQFKPLRPALKMPPLILDNKDKVTRFVSTNGKVEDPLAVEKERSMVNYWTEEERRIFMDNLSEYGKDFTKIASFLTHKTTADCIEFYYKNHKSDFFRKAKKHPDSANQGKFCTTDNYLVTSGKRLIREANACSLDILGAVSEIAANAEECVESRQKNSSKNILGTSSKISRGSSIINHLLFGSSSPDVDDNERENLAANVLAGICSSLSSEAMGSCVTGTIENGEVYHEPLLPYQRTCSSSWQLLEPEVTQDVDETCSEDSCKEKDVIDWTDEEKSTFMQAVLSNGVDFSMISKCVHTRSWVQCKTFFSKARTCLALDVICSGGDHVAETNAANDVGSYACVEADSDTSDDKLALNIEKYSPSPESQLNTESDALHLSRSEPDLNTFEQNDVMTSNMELIDQPDSSTVAEKPVLEQDEHNLSTSEPVSTRLEVNDDAILDLEPMDAKYQPGHLLIDSQVEKLDQGVDNEDKKCQISEPVAGQDEDTPVTSSGISAALHVGEASNVDGGVASNSSEKACAITLQENNYPVSVNMVSSHLSPALNWKTSEEGMLIAQQDNNHQKSLARSGGQHQQRLSGWSLLGNVESLIPNGYAAQITNFRDVDSLQSTRLSDMNQYLVRSGLLQNVNGGIKQLSSAAELPFSSVEQKRNPCFQLVDGSLGVEKPQPSGKVKLFGQILTKPCNQKSSPVVQPFSIIRPSEDQPNVGGYSSTWTTKLDGGSSSRVTDNSQVTSYGFWDGSRIQTGYSSMPNGFGNNSLPSKMDHLQSHNGRTLNFNGFSILPAACPINYQVHRTATQPFPSLSSLQQRQEILLSEMHRRRIETISVVQCSGISDPVAAIRMQFNGPSEQFNGQTTNIIANDEPWRGQGNVGL